LPTIAARAVANHIPRLGRGPEEASFTKFWRFPRRAIQEKEMSAVPFKYEYPRVLSIAGSDSGGGAGIQADIKAVTALGGYAMTAVAALTAQDTHGVRAVMPVPPDFIALQMRLCLADIGADAVKTGMLASA
jgi:hypothetical protein